MSSTFEDRSDAAQDPADLEREAEAIRADMDRTLNALERKFSPEQLLDRSLGILRERGPDLVRTVGDTVRNNPIPVLLTLTGAAWLIASAVRSNSTEPSRLSQRLGQTRLGSRLQETANTVRDRASTATQTVRERAYSATESTRNRASQTWRTARDATRERARQTQAQVENFVQEQPLLVGAIAVAVGAAIGAALPTTAYENRTLGDLRDRTIEKARQVGQDQYQNLRASLSSGGNGSTQNRSQQSPQTQPQTGGTMGGA
jgi:ElaB/YqjD/DUF883 family membrane-anchored ribosome-binding protein